MSDTHQTPDSSFTVVGNPRSARKKIAWALAAIAAGIIGVIVDRLVDVRGGFWAIGAAVLTLILASMALDDGLFTPEHRLRTAEVMVGGIALGMFISLAAIGLLAGDEADPDVTTTGPGTGSSVATITTAETTFVPAGPSGFIETPAWGTIVDSPTINPTGTYAQIEGGQLYVLLRVRPPQPGSERLYPTRVELLPGQKWQTDVAVVVGAPNEAEDKGYDLSLVWVPDAEVSALEDCLRDQPCRDAGLGGVPGTAMELAIVEIERPAH